MSNTEENFKIELDYYFTHNYKQLLKNIKFLIIKSKEKISSDDLLTETYMYLFKNEDKIREYAINGNTTLNHVIYIFFKRYTYMSFVWGKSDIRMLYKRLYQPKHLELIEEFSDEDQVGHFNITNFDVMQNEIYNDQFILEFVETLNKEDKICFEAFYFGGLNTYKLLAEYLNVSIGTASTIVKDLKNKLKQYININTIH